MHAFLFMSGACVAALSWGGQDRLLQVKSQRLLWHLYSCLVQVWPPYHGVNDKIGHSRSSHKSHRYSHLLFNRGFVQMPPVVHSVIDEIRI